MPTLRIAGGRVIDPAHGVDEVRDLWVRNGQMIEVPEDPAGRADRTIDATGCVVMPGGVDVHCHIVGSKVNAARILQPDDKVGHEPVRRGSRTRSGTVGSVPSSFATGYRYAGLGYTTALDAAIAPLGARHAHHELNDTPVIDRAFLVLVGNNHLALDLIHRGEAERLRDYLAWLLGATRGYGLKVVNPGGVEKWKQGHGNVSTLDERVPGFDVSPRQILEAITSAADELALPHPVHLHGLNLGLPGNAATTLETFRAIDGRRAHFAHIQFHSYGGDPGRSASLESRVPELVDYFNGHSNLTLDVGQVMFGETTAMTADGAVGQYLAGVTGRKWVSQDVELETGCGVVPIRYDDRNLVHALQWAIGLEWFLRAEDPWRIALSTDHPNGGSFLAYPKLIALLMEKPRRDAVLAALPEKVRARSGLAELTREYSLSEIAILTRAAPARILGLTRKGHLGPGADADLTIYQPDADLERMFALPRYVLKAGVVVVDDTELREAPEGATLHVEPGYDQAVVPTVSDWFDRWSSIRFANFPVRPEDVSHAQVV